MAQNHFWCVDTVCPRYHQRVLVTYQARDIDGPQWPPRCQYVQQSEEWDHVCWEPLEIAPLPGAYSMDASSGPGFQAFDVTRKLHGQQVVERIDSLAKLRAVEQDSEQRFRNGEGEPLRFRMWNQTASNKDVGSFDTTPAIGAQVLNTSVAPQKKPNIGVKRHGTTKPDHKLGPGVRRATSPLKGSHG